MCVVNVTQTVAFCSSSHRILMEQAELSGMVGSSSLSLYNFTIQRVLRPSHADVTPCGEDCASHSPPSPLNP